MAKKAPKKVAKSTVEIIKERAASRTKQIKKAKVNLKKAAAVRKADQKLLGPKDWTAKELGRFRSIILEKKQETLEELDTLKESMMDVTTGEYISENSTYSLHMEQGTDAMEREKTFLFASRGSKFLNQLDDALLRLEAGTYGQCKACGLLIPRERLEAVPTATTCAEFKNTNLPCERGRLALARGKKPPADE
jgi:RNA polymerase-binding transcription factor DksA